MVQPPKFPYHPEAANGFGPISDKASEGANFVALASLFRQVLASNPKAFRTTYKAFGVKRRMAYYLATIDRQFDGLEIDEARLLKLGWTKLMVIAGHVNADNVETLLALAEQHTVHELQLLMRNALDQPQRARAHMMNVL